MSAPAYQLGFSSLERQIALDSLALSGDVPRWLHGSLVRIGPAKFEVGRERYNHWFDGLGMLHRFTFGGGRVSYANRFLESEAYREASEKKKISRREFATDPCRSLFGRVLSVFSEGFSDNANVNITRFGGHPLALTETPQPIAFDATSLKSIGAMRFEDELEGQITTAHPHYDPARKKVFSYLTHFQRKCEYNLYSLERGSRARTLVASLPVEEPAYMHSFAMTERYLILAEFPYVVNALRLKLSGKPFIENYKWRSDRGTRFTVVEKETGKTVAVADAEPIFSFHHVNAFEDAGGEIVLDLIAYPNASIIEEFYLDKVRTRSTSRSAGTLKRYRLSFGSKTAREEALMPSELVELPNINYAGFNGRPYRYVYTAGATAAGNFLDKLVKIDLAERSTRSWYRDGCYPGEPVLVPTPGASREDEGVVLSVVLDGNNQRSFLLVLDAHTFQELARATVPHHIPFGFHGQFLEAAACMAD